MKKIILFFAFLFSFVEASLFATEEDNKIIYAMLMNQIQYSLQVIQHYQNKAILEQEYDNIICKIDKTKLKDEKQEAIVAYSNMLSVLTNLKLQENERIFLKEQAEKEKSEAIYKILSGISLAAIYSIQEIGQGIGTLAIGVSSGNATAISQGTSEIARGMTSGLYTGVSALFNYRNAVNQIENSFNRDMFRLSQEQLKSIDSQRNSLFKTYSKFITRYNIPKQYEIKEDQMKWLVETIDSADANSKVRLLNEKRNIFQVFTPFWFELGSAYQEIGNVEKARECYREFERQKQKYSIIDNDSYYTELAKNQIQLAMIEKDYSVVNKYLKIIEADKTVNNESENRFYMATINFSIGNSEKAQKLLKLVIDDNREYVVQSRELYEYIEAIKTSNPKEINTLLLGKVKIASSEEIKILINNLEGRTNIFKEIKNFFTNSEQTVLSDDNLVFILPEKYGKDYQLNLLIDDKVYDSFGFTYDDKYYYFVDLSSKVFFTKNSSFKLIFTNAVNEQFVLKYLCNYYSSGDLSYLSKAFNLMGTANLQENIDISNVSQIDIKSFLFEIKKLQKDKAFKNYLKSEKVKCVSEKYTKAMIALLSKPYRYKNNILLKSKSYIFDYGLTEITTLDNVYEFSKYGELVNETKISRDIPVSLEKTLRDALLGYSEAEYDLGMAYLNGEGIDIDYIEALRWFKLSAFKGNMKAYYQLAICFDNGFGTIKNSKRANYYYKLAADLGHQKAKEKIYK